MRVPCCKREGVIKKIVIGLAVGCVVLIGVSGWQARELTARKHQAVRAEAALREERQIRAEQETATQYLERRERDWKEKAMQLSALVGTLRSSQGSNHTLVAEASGAATSGQPNDAAGGAGAMFG